MGQRVPSPRSGFFDTDVDAKPLDVGMPLRERSRRRLPQVMDRTQPTRHDQMMYQKLCEVFDIMSDSDLVLRTLLLGNVQTLDTVVFEHNTWELPVAAAAFAEDLIPQTVQTELITGLFVAIVVPTATAAPTITIQNAWAQLGDDYVNLNAIINSSAGTGGGSLPSAAGFVLNADSKRHIEIVVSANFPADAFLTFCLFGSTVPATLGEVLH